MIEIQIANSRMQFGSVPKGDRIFLRPIEGIENRLGSGKSMFFPKSPRQYSITKDVLMSCTVLSRSTFMAVTGYVPALPLGWYGSQDEETPLIVMEYNDITTFFMELNKMISGYRARLPTELEWESCYFSETHDRAEFPWEVIDGQKYDPCEFSCYNSNGSKTSMKIPPIGSKKPTGSQRWYDLVGLVREFVADKPKISLKTAEPDWREYPRKKVENFCAAGGDYYLHKGGHYQCPDIDYCSFASKSIAVTPIEGTGFRIALEKK